MFCEAECRSAEANSQKIPQAFKETEVVDRRSAIKGVGLSQDRVDGRDLTPQAEGEGIPDGRCGSHQGMQTGMQVACSRQKIRTFYIRLDVETLNSKQTRSSSNSDS